MTEPTPPRAERDHHQTHLVGVALALVVLAALGPWVPTFTAQTSSRWAFAAAVVDDGTIRIDEYQPMFGADDYAVRGDHIYLDKAPLQPILAVPLYASTRAVGGEPAIEYRTKENLSAWWINLWTGVVPAAALCGLMYAAARRLGSRAAGAAALAISFGTILPVLTTTMYAHLLSTFLGFAAWLVARSGPRSPARLLGAGALVGAAVAAEYTLAIVGAVLLGWLWSEGARRDLGWYVLGGLPFAVLLGLHNTLTFGSPFRSAYSFKPAFEGGNDAIVGLPDLGTGLATLAGSRGILVLTPVVLVALLGGVRLLKERREVDQVLVAAAVFSGLWFVHAGWPNPWGGEVPGPRYLAPALPFLAVPLAGVWQRWPKLVVASAAIGAAVMGFGVLVNHLVGHGGGVIATYFENLHDEGFNPTVFTIAIGPVGYVVQLALVVLAVRLLARRLRAATAAEQATLDEEDPAISPPGAAPA
jgi:hypothetical protein